MNYKIPNMKLCPFCDGESWIVERKKDINPNIFCFYIECQSCFCRTKEINFFSEYESDDDLNNKIEKIAGVWNARINNSKEKLSPSKKEIKLFVGAIIKYKSGDIATIVGYTPEQKSGMFYIARQFVYSGSIGQEIEEILNPESNYEVK